MARNVAPEEDHRGNQVESFIVDLKGSYTRGLVRFKEYIFQ